MQAMPASDTFFHFAGMQMLLMKGISIPHSLLRGGDR